MVTELLPKLTFSRLSDEDPDTMESPDVDDLGDEDEDEDDTFVGGDDDGADGDSGDSSALEE